MHAFVALKAELEQVDELDFIVPSPTFMAEEVTDRIRKERKEFHIPKLNRERSLYGSEFEFHLRSKLTQGVIAPECADWLRREARFMSNRTQAPMQPFACVEPGDAVDARTVYMPLHGFTAVDLGYQPGNAVSNLLNKLDEPPFTATCLQLFDKIWNGAEKVEDVTGAIVDHIATRGAPGPLLQAGDGRSWQAAVTSGLTDSAVITVPTRPRAPFTSVLAGNSR
jgi:hypothetical protein